MHARIVPGGNSINPIEYLPIKDIGFTLARGKLKLDMKLMMVMNSKGMIMKWQLVLMFEIWAV